MTDSSSSTSTPETTALAALSAEQLAALNEDQKATFCMLHETDQVFFVKAFKPKDLPIALDRKKALILSNREQVEQWEALRSRFSQPLAVQPDANQINVKDIGLALAGVAGLGAAVAIASDGTAQWTGIEPRDLVPSLQTEFADKERTDFEVTGGPDALEGTVYLISSRQFVPALNIHLTRVQDGTQVKVSDLTSEGLIEAVKKGGQTLFRLAQKGFSLVTFGRRDPVGALRTAGSLFEDGTDIAGLAHDMRLDKRAWECIKGAADSLERARQEQRRQEQEARYALEQAWDHYYNCPRCSVPFGEGDKSCQVCGAERPAKPDRPDPRQSA